MKILNKTLFFFLALVMTSPLSAHGVLIVDAEAGIYLPMTESTINVTVDNQISIVTTRQTFYNDSNGVIKFKYGFPMHKTASATRLRWLVDGVWKEAEFSSKPQDNSLPGTGGHGGFPVPELVEYLGEFPFYFQPKDSLFSGEEISIELTYVELLPYAHGKVSFHYPNDYTNIQLGTSDGLLEFNLELLSDRSIVDMQLLGQSAMVNFSSNTAQVEYHTLNFPPDEDFIIQYELASDELGIYDLSTMLNDSSVTCDNYGNGFVSLIIEPESDVNTAVIEKNFTLVIDRSGSMSGDKMIQARDAASFIVNNLNLGDHFNIIDFSTPVNNLSNSHLPYNASTQTQALNYINNLSAGGSTNISGALTTSIQQFSGLDPNKANIIIFFTDGRATTGIYDTPGILEAVRDAVQQSGTTIFLYTFGIGAGANRQLLTLLAQQNNGTAAFLENDELQLRITDFFLTINNPVLLSPEITFTPNLISEVYPSPLPNLYKGQQLILSGRYSTPGTVNVELKGTAFNVPVVYNYDISLADHAIVDHQFLPKIWSKSKIDDLTIDFYSAPTGSPLSNMLEAEIDSISLCYGVSSDFTSLVDDWNNGNGNGGGVVSTEEFEVYSPADIGIMVLPNPFQDRLEFAFLQPELINEEVEIRIYNNLGQLVALLTQRIGGQGASTIKWNGKDWHNQVVASGVYFCHVAIGDRVQTLKVVKVD